MMTIIVLFILTLVCGFGLLIWIRLKENRFLKKSVKESLGLELRAEIEKEQKDYKKKQEMFEQALKKKTKVKQIPS